MSEISDFITKNKKTLAIVGVSFGLLAIIGKKLFSMNLTKDEFLELVNSNLIVYPTKTIRKISSKFGNRIHPVTKKASFHNGIDIPAPAKTPIYAPISGEVVMNSYNAAGGNQVIIKNGDIRFGFAHLFEKPNLKVGQKVEAGQVIGLIGSTGTSTGNHLHLTLKIGNDVVDPKTALKQYA